MNIIRLFEKRVPKSKIIIHSQRQYGDKKLSKPKELKGIKQSFSVDWIPKKCRCACFVKDDDIYIKHRDYKSIDVYGVDYETKRKFCYRDNFGCVVLRGEAWIVIKDIALDIQNDVFIIDIFQSLAEQITGEIGSCMWERFFEKVIKEYIKVGDYSEC